MKNNRELCRKLLKIIFVLLILVAVIPGLINGYMILRAAPRIISQQEALQKDAQCIMVLGAGIIQNERPTSMLRDRLSVAVALYHADAAGKVLMSGDNSRKDYDEVGVMRAFALDKGLKPEDVFMDHAGFSTYESMYRAKEIFGVQRVIIITQKYHMYRALYIADKLGLDAVGVYAPMISYPGENYREFREILARTKDFFLCIIKPPPKFLGEKIQMITDDD